MYRTNSNYGIGIVLCIGLLLAASPVFASECCAAEKCCAANGPVELFNGEDMSDWNTLRQTSKWFIAKDVAKSAKNPKLFDVTKGQGIMVNGDDGRTTNILSKYEHGDCQLHIEFVVPKGSNSGVYLQSLYEIQVFDSYGKDKVTHTDCGGIYQRWDEKNNKAVDQGEAPFVNASKAPGEWQSFDITFRAPRFKDGKMVEKPRFVLVVHNGVVVHQDFELQGPTRAFNGKQKPAPKAPLMLQGDHGPVAYRNIKLTPITIK